MRIRKLTIWATYILIIFWFIMLIVLLLSGCSTTRPTPTGEFKVIKIVVKDKDGNMSTKYIGQIK